MLQGVVGQVKRDTVNLFADLRASYRSAPNESDNIDIASKPIAC